MTTEALRGTAGTFTPPVVPAQATVEIDESTTESKTEPKAEPRTESKAGQTGCGTPGASRIGPGTLWQPASACGDHCRDGDFHRAAPVMAVVRVTALVAVLLVGLLPVALLRGAALRIMARAILAVLGIRVVWRGPVPRAGSMVVANHVSWLDPVALAAVLPVRMVAKHDVRSWPGIGGTTARAGVIFIDRTRPSELPRTVDEIATALRSGDSVAVFPEGTTCCGPDQGLFRPALFQAAIDAGAPVAPVSIGYDSTEASFVADDTLGESVVRVARVRRLTVTLVAAPSLRPAPGADRRALARAAQSSLAGGGYRLAA